MYIEKGAAAKLLQTLPGVIMEEFTTLIQEYDTGSILDLGCGFGNYLPYFTKRGYTVVGSDISAVAIKIAKTRLKKQIQQNTHLILQDMRYLPFRENSFDGIISINVIYHATMNEIKKVVSEIYRVLQNGAIGLVTLISDTDFKFDSTRATRKKTLLAESEAESGVVHSFFNREDVYNLLKAFKILKLEKEDQKIGNKLSSHWFVLFIKESIRS